MFAAATLVPMAVLSWLGFKVLEQDRVAERQRRLDALEVSAQRLAVDLERWLQEVASRPGRGRDRSTAPDRVSRTAGRATLVSAVRPADASGSGLAVPRGRSR